MSDKQKKALADGLISIGNIVAGSLVFGQFITQSGLQLITIIFGILLTALFYLAALSFLKGKER